MRSVCRVGRPPIIPNHSQMADKWHTADEASAVAERLFTPTNRLMVLLSGDTSAFAAGSVRQPERQQSAS